MFRRPPLKTAGVFGLGSRSELTLRCPRYQLCRLPPWPAGVTVRGRSHGLVAARPCQHPPHGRKVIGLETTELAPSGGAACDSLPNAEQLRRLGQGDCGPTGQRAKRSTVVRHSTPPFASRRLGAWWSATNRGPGTRPGGNDRVRRAPTQCVRVRTCLSCSQHAVSGFGWIRSRRNRESDRSCGCVLRDSARDE
jgi:hypothetical protein